MSDDTGTAVQQSRDMSPGAVQHRVDEVLKDMSAHKTLQKHHDDLRKGMERAERVSAKSDRAFGSILGGKSLP